MSSKSPREPAAKAARNPSEETAHFGYQDVPAARKGRLVQGVFQSVAENYDLMNDLMSGGIHRLWKSAMIDWLDPKPGQRFVDVAGGTGDIALRILDRLRAYSEERDGGAAPVTVCDLTPEMLRVGRNRALDRGVVGGLNWICGDAQSLPLPDRSFDAYTIAFGLRNVTRIESALSEAHRVLRPGGRFLCLEFSRVVVPLFADLYDLYSFKVLPAMGQTVAKDRESYRYLAESIRRFPPQEELAAMMRAAGLEQVSYRNLTGGIAALHSGWRI